MNKATKLTLAELLRRKEQMIASKKIKKTMDLYIKSIDSVITIEEPDGALCRDANDMEAGEGDKYMCYECIKEPDIKMCIRDRYTAVQVTVSRQVLCLMWRWIWSNNVLL